MRPPRFAVALAVSLACGVLAGCAQVDEAKSIRDLAEQTLSAQGAFEALPVQAADVYRVVASSSGVEVELLHDDLGVWNPGEGATDTAAAVMVESEKVLLPTLAYRHLNVDPNDAQFGLRHPALSFLVETRTAKQYRLDIGLATLNGGGYYAKRAGDPSVYTVIPAVVDSVRSILAGEKIVRPPDPVVNAAIAAVDATDDDELVKNPWLAQVLEFDQ